MPIQNKLKAVWIASLILLIAASFTKGVDPKHALGLDVLFHIGIYAILAAVPLCVMRKRLASFIVTISVAPLSFFFETLHGSVTGWGFEMLDAFYNNMGISLGIVIGLLVRMKQHFANEQKSGEKTEPR